MSKVRITRIESRPTFETLLELVLESEQASAYEYYQDTQRRLEQLIEWGMECAYLCDNGKLYYKTTARDGLKLINEVNLGSSCLHSGGFIEVSAFSLAQIGKGKYYKRTPEARKIMVKAQMCVSTCYELKDMFNPLEGSHEEWDKDYLQWTLENCEVEY